MITKKTSALIIDSVPMIQQSLEKILNTNNQFEQIFIADNNVTAMKVIKEQDVNLIILDSQQQGFDGLDFLRRIKASTYDGKILFISSSEHYFYESAAQRMGADGFILKTEKIETIQHAISHVMSGYSLFKNYCHKPLPTLSQREIIVYGYLINGVSNKNIAKILSISHKTVSTYRSRILQKCQVDSVVELAKLHSEANLSFSGLCSGEF
ncbi:MAG: response regulator [Vibrio sp.]|uniref:response regulator n=1 Tax=Vibrio sp. TaxID=678 RepID=UPI003A868B72